MKQCDFYVHTGSLGKLLEHKQDKQKVVYMLIEQV